MELIIMTLLTTLSLIAGIVVGRYWAKDIYELEYTEGYNEGYTEGFEEGQASIVSEEFPKTLDGKFFSTDAAIRSISMKRGD